MKTMEDHVFYRNLRKYYPTAHRGERIYIYDTEASISELSHPATICSLIPHSWILKGRGSILIARN